jgi:hypothetical protein
MQHRLGSYFIFLVSCVAGCLWTDASGSNSKVAINSLSKIEPVAVFVSEIPDWMIDDEITREGVKDTVQRSLHDAGIPISPAVEGAGAYLVVVFQGKRVEVKNAGKIPVFYSYTSNLSLLQKVKLLNSGEESVGTTWYAEHYGFATGSSKAVAQDILHSVDKNVATFLTDYKKAHSGISMH